MRLVIVSDTHCAEIDLPDGDVLIHCGDHTYLGKTLESEQALRWLANKGKFKHRLCIAGNHELAWQVPTFREFLFKGFPELTYLHDEGVTIDGIKFWGSPVQPEFHGWAFQLARGEPLKKHWSKVPEGIDVLITHGPPKDIMDMNEYDTRFGDEDLLNRVLEVKPQIHCFGHAHHGHGEVWKDDIRFINAAIMTEEYKPLNKPIVVDIEPRVNKH